MIADYDQKTDPEVSYVVLVDRLNLSSCHHSEFR